MLRPSHLCAILVLLALTVLLACGGGDSASSGGGGGIAPPRDIQHVAIVAMENQSFEDVMAGGAMPYFQQLAAQGSLAENFYANLHPSIGNYFIITAGNLISRQSDFGGTYSGDTVVRRLVSSGKSWKAYLQSVPSQGYTGTDVYPYVKRHNPFAYYTDVRDTAQRNNLVPLSQLSADIGSNALPRYMFIVPDQRNNGHDCPTGDPLACPNSVKLASADNFLKAHIAPLLANPSFAQNGLLILWWDEGAASDTRNGGGRIAVVLAGPRVKNGFRSDTRYMQESILRLSMQTLGLEGMGTGANATQMGEFFK